MLQRTASQKDMLHLHSALNEQHAPAKDVGSIDRHIDSHVVGGSYDDCGNQGSALLHSQALKQLRREKGDAVDASPLMKKLHADGDEQLRQVGALENGAIGVDHLCQTVCHTLYSRNAGQCAGWCTSMYA